MFFAILARRALVVEAPARRLTLVALITPADVEEDTFGVGVGDDASDILTKVL